MAGGDDILDRMLELARRAEARGWTPKHYRMSKTALERFNEAATKDQMLVPTGRALPEGVEARFNGIDIVLAPDDWGWSISLERRA